MPKVFTADKQKIGKLGEELAKKFLMKHGYSVLEENYTKKYGEIDIIAEKDQVLHFIEVKSMVSRDTICNVPRETSNLYDVLSNVHPAKLKRLSRVIQVYLVTHETEKWQFDVITVKINEKNKIGTVKHLQNIIL